MSKIMVRLEVSLEDYCKGRVLLPAGSFVYGGLVRDVVMPDEQSQSLKVLPPEGGRIVLFVVMDEDAEFMIGNKVYKAKDWKLNEDEEREVRRLFEEGS